MISTHEQKSGTYADRVRDGFVRFDKRLSKKKEEFFSEMMVKAELGKIVEIANRELSYGEKAEKFLELIRRGDKVVHFQ